MLELQIKQLAFVQATHLAIPHQKISLLDL
jgi:hypothetical protein